MFTCPATGLKVHGWSAHEEGGPATEYYVATECSACGHVHFVAPEAGKVMGEEDD